MPGYVMHLAEAELIINALRKEKDLTWEWEQAFTVGTLLPDTKIRQDKRYSHFWNPDLLDHLALGPDLGRFLEKYGDQLDNPVMLGYLAHLHLDTCYVDTFWPTVFEFYGSDGQPAVLRDDIKEVYIRYSDQRVPIGDFFSVNYYYGEYTKLNGYYIDTYNLSIPAWDQIPDYREDFHMDEVSYDDIGWVCRELGHLLSCYHKGDEGRLQVFTLDQLENFIHKTTEAFLKSLREDAHFESLMK